MGCRLLGLVSKKQRYAHPVRRAVEPRFDLRTSFASFSPLDFRGYCRIPVRTIPRIRQSAAAPADRAFFGFPRHLGNQPSVATNRGGNSARLRLADKPVYFHAKTIERLAACGA